MRDVFVLPVVNILPLLLTRDELHRRGSLYLYTLGCAIDTYLFLLQCLQSFRSLFIVDNKFTHVYLVASSASLFASVCTMKAETQGS